jgi:hypothetical protein
MAYLRLGHLGGLCHSGLPKSGLFYYEDLANLNLGVLPQ